MHVFCDTIRNERDIMQATVIKVASPRVIRLSTPWNFHGISGTYVSIAGLRSVAAKDEASATQAVTTLLLNKPVEIAERWYVRGRTLVGVVLHDGKDVSDLLPDRKAQIVEPSRRFNPADHHTLVRISTGIPTSWKNPLSREPDGAKAPFFGDVAYPTKLWEPRYPQTLRLVERLYCHERFGTQDAERRFQKFVELPSPQSLLVFGDGGVGKSWFVMHKITQHTPPKSHYAYIDLRGRPKGADLTLAMHAELGLFLDHWINMQLDALVAFSHYLIPRVKPAFGSRFDPNGKRERELMQQAFLQISCAADKLVEYNDMRLGYYDNHDVTLFVVVDNVDTYAEDEQQIVMDYITRSLMSHSGIKVIVPVRPTSRFLIERLKQVAVRQK